jgi:hypothetical protein
LVRCRHAQLYERQLDDELVYKKGISKYNEKQLTPIADMVLRFFDLDYRLLTKGGRQLSLF